MTRVAVQFGPLMVMHRVLDGQRVQAELLLQDLQVVEVGGEQVEPDHGVRMVPQPGRDQVDAESFVDHLPGLVEAGVGRASRRGRRHVVNLAARSIRSSCGSSIDA
jgi:hypothetical protein